MVDIFAGSERSRGSTQHRSGPQRRQAHKPIVFKHRKNQDSRLQVLSHSQRHCQEEDREDGLHSLRSVPISSLTVRPEIWNETEQSTWVDVWSLGCLLYELCSLTLPFDKSSPYAVIKAILKGKYKPISNYYSKELVEIVDWCLCPNPEDRPTCSKALVYD